jgi:hypothetical protein
MALVNPRLGFIEGAYPRVTVRCVKRPGLGIFQLEVQSEPGQVSLIQLLLLLELAHSGA